MVTGLCYMHSKNIVHRDLKLENIMIQLVKDEKTKSTEIIVKLTDFGFACEIDPEVGSTLSLGSPTYTAPEVIRASSSTGNKYDARCDVWSLGVMVFMILTNTPPFAGRNKREIYAAA